MQPFLDTMSDPKYQQISIDKLPKIMNNVRYTLLNLEHTMLWRIYKRDFYKYQKERDEYTAKLKEKFDRDKKIKLEIFKTTRAIRREETLGSMM